MNFADDGGVRPNLAQAGVVINVPLPTLDTSKPFDIGLRPRTAFTPVRLRNIRATRANRMIFYVWDWREMDAPPAQMLSQ
jgi:hypothetical protein